MPSSRSNKYALSSVVLLTVLSSVPAVSAKCFKVPGNKQVCIAKAVAIVIIVAICIVIFVIPVTCCICCAKRRRKKESDEDRLVQPETGQTRPGVLSRAGREFEHSGIGGLYMPGGM